MREAVGLYWAYARYRGQGEVSALSKSTTTQARAVQRARIILSCLEGKEIQQVARELGVSVLTVSEWRQRFSLWG